MQTVMNILTNLKEGLIVKIEEDGVTPVRQASYTPKVGQVVDEAERPMGKYISPSVYKSRLKKR